MKNIKKFLLLFAFLQTSQSIHSVSIGKIAHVAQEVIVKAPAAYIGSRMTSWAWRALVRWELGHFDEILKFNKRFHLNSDATQEEKRFLVKYGKTIDTILRRTFFCVAMTCIVTHALKEAQ